MASPDPPLVLRAVSALSAAGEGTAALLDAALAARPLAAPVERYDVQNLRTPVAALLPAALRDRLAREHPGLDPALALALEAVRQATAGAPLDERTALLVGTSLGGTASWERWHRDRIGGAPSPAPPVAAHGDLAGALARHLGLRGPCLTVSTACTSSAAALLLAADLLTLGEADRALVVGVDVLGTFVHTGFDALRALSPPAQPPAPFGEGRAGLWLGEGAACAWVERGGPGRARLLSGATAGDAFHMTAPEPSGRGLVRAIRGALEAAALTPSEVVWVSAHATGTAFNDAMEAGALHQVFGAALPPVHALKPVLGHTLGAAALLEVALIVEAMARGVRPPSFLDRPLDAGLAPLPLDAHPAPLAPGPVLSLNAAFAGHNTALVLAPP